MQKWYREHGIKFERYVDDGENRLVKFYYKFLVWKKDTPAFRSEISAGNYPVLATSGGYSELPASPPVAKFQASLRFAAWIREEAATFIRHNLQGRYLGIHVRNAPDWKHACDLKAVTHMVDHCSKPLTMRECHPPLELIVQEAKLLIAKHSLRSIFLAAKKSSDSESFGQRLLRALQQLGVSVATPDFDVPWIDLEILGSAGETRSLGTCVCLALNARPLTDLPHVPDASDAFVGNCGSTFSAYAHRDRKMTRGKNFNYFSGQVTKLEPGSGPRSNTALKKLDEARVLASYTGTQCGQRESEARMAFFNAYDYGPSWHGPITSASVGVKRG